MLNKNFDKYSKNNLESGLVSYISLKNINKNVIEKN